MQKIRTFANGRFYEARVAGNGVYYIHWSEGRRSHRKSTGEKSLRGAQAFLDEFVKAVELDTQSVLTIRDLWTLKYTDSSQRYTYAWKSLEPHFGHLQPSEITQEVEDAYKESRNVAPSTLRLELSLIRAVINNGVRRRKVSASDVPLLDPLPEQSPPRERWLRDAEVDRLFEASKAHRRTHLFLWLALETAARRTAIQELKWDQVDWATGTIHYLPEGDTQTSKRKASVPMSTALRPVLERAYAEKEKRDPYVIGAGGRVNAAVKRVATHAEVPGVTPHVLRHTAATRMARAGVTLFHIAEVLGNTVDQVEKTYAKWQPEMLQDAVNSISKR